MPQVTIKVHEVGQPPVEIGAVGAILKPADLETFIILEAGMASGKTSVMFHARTHDGQDIVIETSAAIVDGIYGALRGAELRFEGKKAKHN